MSGSPRWALEGVPNPAVLRVHVTAELTDRTIVSCPSGIAPPPLDAVLALAGVRSVDLHRYRARVNLRADADPQAVREGIQAAVAAVWGPASPLPTEETARAFPVEYRGARSVAESLQMASAGIARALFRAPGVAEVVLADGEAVVRLGRLFRWDQVEAAVRAAIGAAGA